jgi:anti-sigma factor RsiW
MKMTCERVNGLLTLYVDEGLPARDAGRVAGHLARCAACRAELQALEQTLAVLDRVRPHAPPIDLWEQFRSRLEAQRVDPRVTQSVCGSSERARTGARDEKPAFIPFRSFTCGRGWCNAVAVPAAALAAALVALAGFAIGMGSGGPRADRAMIQATVRGPVAPELPDRSAVEGAAPRLRNEVSTSAPRARRGSDLVELPVMPPIAPPEARMPVSDEAPGLARSRATVPAVGTEPAQARESTNDRVTRRIAATFGQYPSVAPPSADVAEALQSSVEETTRQRVADEVALLAQELNRAEAHTSDFFGPSGSREPS